MPVPTERKGDAGPTLAESREVDVVLERHGEAEAFAQVVPESPPFEPFDVGREPQPARARLHDSRHADHRAVDEVAVEPARLEEGIPKPSCGSQRLAHVGRAQLQVLARPYLARQVADGPAQKARAEVEAEHERGLGHGFEVDRAVARALRRRAGLAHEPGIEERLQRERHRWL